MISTDLKALEALIGRRLKREEVDQLRESADRLLARSRANQAFADTVARLREANPAAVSPRVGFA